MIKDKIKKSRKLNDFAPSEEVYKEHIASKYGLSSKNLRLDVPSVQKMGAKMIWQNYRQGLDREFRLIRPFILISNLFQAQLTTTIARIGTFC